MTMLEPEIIRIEILAGIFHGAVEEGVILPRLGELRCLPGETKLLLPVGEYINVDALVDVPTADDIDEETECIAGIISLNDKLKRRGYSDRGQVLLWGFDKHGKWFTIIFRFCMECDEDGMGPVVYYYSGNFCRLRDVIAQGANPRDIIDTFIRVFAHWKKLSEVMREAWEQADLALSEDLDE